MKRILLIFVLLVSCSILFAQKVKVKKGIILVDKNKVAKIEKNDGIYKVSDLNDKVLFFAEATSTTIKGNKTNDLWLRFKGANGNVREIEQTKRIFSFSSEKIITKNLVVGPAAFFSASGINTSLLNDFFSKKDTPISDKIDSQYATIKDRHQKEDKIAEELKLYINKNAEVCLDKKIVGKILKKEEKNTSIASYLVVDLKDFPVAVAHFNTKPHLMTVLRGAKLKTFDKKEHTINEVYSSNAINEDKLANRIVKMLYANDYKIEEASDKYHSAANQKNKDAYNKALANSINIFDVEGYIIDKKGKKIEGIISIPYENIKAKMNPNSGISDMSNYGGFVNVKNAEGKIKSYKAKHGVIVFIGDRIFVGAHGVGDGNLGNSSGSELSLLGESQFFEVDYQTKAGYILHHPKSPQYYYIMLKGNDKAYYLGNKGFLKKKSKEKMEKLFNKALNCSSLKFSNYDTLSKKGMIKILDDYTSNCSK